MTNQQIFHSCLLHALQNHSEALLQTKFTFLKSGMLYLPTQKFLRFPIGEERITCRGSKLTNSLGRTKVTNSLGKQHEVSTRTHMSKTIDDSMHRDCGRLIRIYLSRLLGYFSIRTTKREMCPCGKGKICEFAHKLNTYSPIALQDNANSHNFYSSEGLRFFLFILRPASVLD